MLILDSFVDYKFVKKKMRHKRSIFSRVVHVCSRCDFQVLTKAGRCNKKGVFVYSESCVRRAFHPEQNDLV